MKWAAESLWLKAKRYSDRAHLAKSGSSDFPFFCALAVEFLTRAALASVHPALIADPKDDGVSILYAFGFAPKGQPKTVEMKTVISRLSVIVPSFGELHAKSCLDLVYLRNAELHSGEIPFEGKKEASWLPGFYAAADCICQFMKRDLVDLLGKDQANGARTMIGEAKGERITAVKRKISSHKDVFEAKPSEERDGLRAKAKEISLAERLGMKRSQGIAIEPCPACGGNARKLGVLVAEGEPKLVEALLEVERTYLTQHLRCPVCNLHLESPEDLRIAGLEPRFSLVVRFDPRDMFEFEEDDPYMNM
jgi:hypothetical protein